MFRNRGKYLHIYDHSYDSSIGLVKFYEKYNITFLEFQATDYYYFWQFWIQKYGILDKKIARYYHSLPSGIPIKSSVVYLRIQKIKNI